MKSRAKPGSAYRAGRLMGAAVRWFLKQEAGLVGKMVNAGVPVRLCKLGFLALKITLIGLLLYVAFWAALITVGLWAVSEMGRRGMIPDRRETDDDGWRHGASGFGYYCGEYRVDQARFDDE